uniref:RING-type E3 ubiquitin transferase n=1 Tax=Lactuca sativa TaxID=4236 RepID=A0A9R1WG47_LACSA|nr:hypothetical protein LSAT_V11C100008190 [Lactuca sativa]
MDKTVHLRSFVCYPSLMSSHPFRCCVSMHDVCLPSTGTGRVNKASNLHIHDAIADKIENQDQSNKRCIHLITLRCDQMFFSEIMKEDFDIMGCISSRVKHLVQLHCKIGMPRYDQQALVLEGQMLIKYVIMNAIALRKILKKYDKVHNSVCGVNFRSKLQAEHLEILHSPWLIELVAFYMNFSESNEIICYELCSYFSCDLSVIISKLVLKLVLPDYVVLEYSLTCVVCLAQLSVTPRKEGRLKVTGVSWKLSDSMSLPRLKGIITNLPSTVYTGNLERLSLELRNSLKINMPGKTTRHDF